MSGTEQGVRDRRVRTAFYTFGHGRSDVFELPGGYTVEEFLPRALRLRSSADPSSPPLPMYVFWRLLSVARYRIFYVWHEGRIVHASHLLWRNPRLAFMGRDDVHIGPCWTDPGHRGRRLFPAVIGRIATRFRDRTVWMIADEDNVASRRGIKRAGFRFVGYGGISAGRYRLDNAGSA